MATGPSQTASETQKKDIQSTLEWLSKMANGKCHDVIANRMTWQGLAVDGTDMGDPNLLI